MSIPLLHISPVGWVDKVQLSLSFKHTRALKSHKVNSSIEFWAINCSSGQLLGKGNGAAMDIGCGCLSEGDKLLWKTLLAHFLPKKVMMPFWFLEAALPAFAGGFLAAPDEAPDSLAGFIGGNVDWAFPEDLVCPSFPAPQKRIFSPLEVARQTTKLFTSLQKHSFSPLPHGDFSTFPWSVKSAAVQFVLEN